MNKSLSAVILSSGLSERMGQHKALLKWDRNTTFLEKILIEFSLADCDPIICMINKHLEHFCKDLTIPGNTRFVVNHHPEWGRLYSIRTGLREMPDSEFCFIHNVDNPFPDQEIIGKIGAKKNPESWCSPVFKGRSGHPVLLPEFIIREIVKTENLNQTLSDILTLFPKTNVEVFRDAILNNINTPEDYQKYFGSIS